MSNYTGCPCGCMTKLPWLDDPDCARHRPLPPDVPSLREILIGRDAEDTADE